MKKLIDIPDEHIPTMIRMAKFNGQSVKSYMQQAIIATILIDTERAKIKKRYDGVLKAIDKTPKEGELAQILRSQQFKYKRSKTFK